MARNWLRGLGKHLLAAGTALIFSAGIAGSARGDEAELRGLIEQQAKQIEELKHRLDTVQDQPPAAPGGGNGQTLVDEGAVKQIIGNYLRENPGAGMPPSVQTGYEAGNGFYVRSAPNPVYQAWKDESRIPFEMRFRGRMQLDYWYYGVNDTLNHLTGARTNLGNNRPFGDYSQLEINRARFAWFGTAFSPNLRYWMELDGTTRGLAGVNNVGAPQANGIPDVGGAGQNPLIPGNGSVTVDHSVRLFSAFIAYDWHPCCASAGCGKDCPPDSRKYSPTVTFILGKYKPFFSFEEVLGSGNQQFVSYGMSEWYFDADDDNLMMQAGIQFQGMEDRLYATFNLDNANETQTAALTNQVEPGCNGGFWYDFGGTWNAQRQRYDLYGDSVADIDYSPKPVVRVGAMTNLAPMSRRSIYGIANQARMRIMDPAPGGTNLPGLLSGGGVGTPGQFALDEFNMYSAEAFVAGKYRGFSLLNDWWYRDTTGFKGTNASGLGSPVTYSIPGVAGNFLFPKRPLTDYGMMLQGGYFLIPRKLEVAGRWSYLRGNSGDVYGNGKVAETLTLNGARVTQFQNAFRDYHEADEYGICVNYYFKRQLLKWQNDLSTYRGGNPAGGGQSPAGYIPGVDGWMFRSQIQIWF